jgi:C4-dicarboxylate-specific signal transduction histidine kinase
MKINSLMKKNDLDSIKEVIELNETVIDHMSKTLDSISHYHNIEDKKAKINLTYLLENVLVLLNHNLVSNDIKISISCDPQLHIHTIKSCLIHVLLIVINNSIEALAKKKKGIKEIKVDVYKNDKKVFIQILDNGSGIKSEAMKNLFKPGNTTKKEAGHGYGLYFAKNILEGRLNSTIEYIKNKDHHYFLICLNE